MLSEGELFQTGRPSWLARKYSFLPMFLSFSLKYIVKGLQLFVNFQGTCNHCGIFVPIFPDDFQMFSFVQASKALWRGQGWWNKREEGLEKEDSIGTSVGPT